MRLNITLQFYRACYDYGEVVGVFKEKYPKNNYDRAEEYLVEEVLIADRLLGSAYKVDLSDFLDTQLSALQNVQFDLTPLWRFSDCEVSEHDLIKAMGACRDLRNARRRQMQYLGPA